MAGGSIEVVTWNLFHGRAVPDVPHDLFEEFAATLDSWSWDVALLQEAPPWWPEPLAAACGAVHDLVLSARNECLPLRRWAAVRWPHRLGSWGGGCNAILVRRRAVAARWSRRLRWWPERRAAHAVLLADGTVICNLHAAAHSERRARADVAKALAGVQAWAGTAPLIFGGDLNLRHPRLPGLVHAAARDVDHLFARGFALAAPANRPRRGQLSDHPPLRVQLNATG